MSTSYRKNGFLPALLEGTPKIMRTTPHRNDRKSPALRKLSINVSQEIGLRLKRLAFEQDVSESSIIEIALREFLEHEPRRGWENALRQKGATLRRPPES